MATAIGGDLAATALPGGERDSFPLRDPPHIERTLPALRMTSKLYFRADVRGLEHIPPCRRASRSRPRSRSGWASRSTCASGLGQQRDSDEGYKLVTSTMQRTLTRRSSQRSLPVIG